ncbi:MAG: hypothetical protein CMG59_06620 [Candidatus Marinimicrobia bacterium]|nr:hypothetical protein [Candidatus Neomarinimicrobiota bacterium]
MEKTKLNESNQILLNEYLEYLKIIKKYSNHTLRNYTIDLNQFKDFIHLCNSNLIFIELNKEHIKEFLFSLHAKKMSDKSISRKVATLKSFYKYMYKNNIIDNNIMKSIKSPKISKKLPHLLSMREIKELFNIELDDERILMEMCILIIFYSTGIRISELARIELKNIKLSNRIIRVFGKGKKERDVILSKKSVVIIEKYIEAFELNGKKYLFESLSKKNISGHISEKTIYNITKKHLKRISNDEKLSPHSIRHSFATHLLQSGADMMSVKELLGHESLSSTQVYTHVQLEKMKKDYKKSHPLEK